VRPDWARRMEDRMLPSTKPTRAKVARQTDRHVGAGTPGPAGAPRNVEVAGRVSYGSRWDCDAGRAPPIPPPAPGAGLSVTD